MKKINAFTLVELTIVLAIVGILATAAAPSMRSYISNSSANSLTNTLLIDIMYARNHAISNQVIVKMIPTGIQNSGVSEFKPNSAGVNWGQGWVIFEDDNKNDVDDPTDDNNLLDKGEKVIRRHVTLGPDAHVSSSPQAELLDANKPIGFNGQGLAYGLGANTGRGTLKIATFGCAGLNASTIQINHIGQVIKNDVQCPDGFTKL